MEERLLELFEKRCKELKLPKRRLRREKLILIGYVRCFLDMVRILKDSA